MRIQHRAAVRALTVHDLVPPQGAPRGRPRGVGEAGALVVLPGEPARADDRRKDAGRPGLNRWDSMKEEARMTTKREIKEKVRERYAERARSVSQPQDASCCGPEPTESVISSDLYTTDELRGLPQEAVVASLGCGNPVAM